MPTPHRPLDRPAVSCFIPLLLFLVEELKPAVNREYRTLTGREHTALVGSSLGGLISAYAGTVHPDHFGLIGAMSPSTWWDNRWIVTAVSGFSGPLKPLKVYVDSGNGGTSMDGAADTARLADAYRMAGFSEGTNFKYVVQEGGLHNETFWAQRLPGTLGFLLGAGR